MIPAGRVAPMTNTRLSFGLVELQQLNASFTAVGLAALRFAASGNS